MSHVSTGQIIRYWRLRRGLSQSRVAEILGVSAQAVSQWERGVHAPRDAHVLALADALGLTRAKFFGAEGRA